MADLTQDLHGFAVDMKADVFIVKSDFENKFPDRYWRFILTGCI